MLARQSNNTPAAEEAVRRASLLEPRLSKLIIEIAPENRGEALAVRQNGKALEPALYGAAFPIDPGEHAFEAAAPGKQAWSTKVRIEAKPGVTTVRVPALAKAASRPAPVAPPSKPVKAPVAAPDRPSGWSTQRTVGLVLGGVGVLGVAGGAVATGLTVSTMDEAIEKRYCTDSDPPQCNQQGYELHRRATTTANIANVAFAVGGASLVAGVVVFAMAPSGDPKKKPSGLRVEVGPAVGMGTAGLSVRGGW
jgi:hypothetical protein